MKNGKISFKRGLIGVFALAIVLVSTSWVCAGWIVVSPPAVSSDWTLYGVHFTSTSEGWAVGSDFFYNGKGVLLHFKDNAWTSVTPPPVSSDWELFSVHFASATEGWAVGRDNLNKKGVLLRYLDGSWTSVSPPYSSTSWYLNSVYFTSATEGWAVGVDDTASVANSGVLLHYLNGSWSAVSPPYVSSNWTLEGVQFTSSGEGWAVGDNKVSIQGGGILLHYRNGTWLRVLPPNAGTDWDLRSVYFTSASGGWAVGNDYAFPVKTGFFMRYVNGTWTTSRPSHPSLSWNLLSLHFVSPSNGWAVGIDVPAALTQTGLIARYSSGSWSFVTPPLVSENWGLSWVHFASSDEGWAVGGDNSNGRGVLLKYSILPDIAVTPSSIDFGNVSAGKTSEKKITIKNQGGVTLTLDTIGSVAAPFSRSGGSCKDGQILIPNAMCTVLIKYAPLADAFFTSSLDITSDDPDEPSVTVNLAGRFGPADMAGTWGSLTQTCTTTTGGIRCRLNGTLVVENTGYKDVPAIPYSYVNFYLSEDGSFDPVVDTYLKRMLIGKVKFDVSKNIVFAHRFPLGVSASGKYIFAVIDANNKVTEVDETNNAVVSDVIPPIP